MAARPLALVDRDAGSPEEADEARAITARALDREGGHTELLRPGEQPLLARPGG
jgi:hypothetical protein